MTKRSIQFATLVLVLLLSAMHLSAQSLNPNDVFEPGPKGGGTNWTTGLITAIGIGTPSPNAANRAQMRAMALRAAKVDAQRNLLEILNNVQVTAVSNVRDLSLQHDDVESRVQGLLHGAQPMGEPRYLPDGSVEVTLGVYRHDVEPIVMPKVLETHAPSVPSMNMPMSLDPNLGANPPVAPPAGPQDSANAMPTPPLDAGRAFTGLLIDARDFKVRPAMAPKIVDESGREIYGSSLVNPEYAVQHGMIGYSKNIQAAQTNERIANTPLIIKGIKTDGDRLTDIVVSNADAEKIRSAAQTQKFLNQARVMIVL